MSQIILLLLITLSLLLSITISTTTATASNSSLTAYDLLQSYGFPVGILPKGIKSYDLDTTTGKFNLYLNGTCSFSLEGSYDLKYKSKVSGIISKNKLADLSGVSVKVLILWLNIVEVRRCDDDVAFSVGIASANFPVDNFEISPQCGCGFNCDSVGNKGQIRKMKLDHSVSSI